MTTSLDVVAATRHYIDRIIQGDGKCTGSMKVLLTDAVTTQILSSVYSQTEILRQQVYLVSRLDGKDSYGNGRSGGPGSPNKKDQQQSHLKAVCFLRPTAANLDLLTRELKAKPAPRFAEYHIFFSGTLPPNMLKTLAQSDISERVQQVQEFYADFLPVNEDLVTLQSNHSIAMSTAAGTSWAPKFASEYERTLAGLSSMLLALKRQPSCIRYAGHSPCAEELAKDLFDTIQQDDLYHFRKKPRSGGTMVLVLDRRDDPVTPLLSQWTYQAMVHELLGLNNHRVILRGAPNVAKDLEEVVLSPTQDDFFYKNRHKNFGELGEEIQRLLQDYQRQTAQHSVENLNTIEDMQAFMDKFPELRSRSHNVSKHVAIMGELARLVEVCSLMDVSQFEQELACSDDHTNHWRELMEKLGSKAVKIPDKLRLGLLYALRYEVSGNLHMVQSAMSKGGVPADMVALMNVMLRYAGTKSRGPGLFHHNLMSKMTKIMTSVQGVQNVYSQHVPLLMETIQSLCKGKLPNRTHPVVPGSSTVAQPADQLIPEEIIVFMVGGVTYEEATKVSEFNAIQAKTGTGMAGGVRIVLAGTTVHNSTSFLEELKATSI